jgi:Bacterial extracellular solute-binding proteins, family 3
MKILVFILLISLPSCSFLKEEHFRVLSSATSDIIQKICINNSKTPNIFHPVIQKKNFPVKDFLQTFTQALTGCPIRLFSSSSTDVHVILDFVVLIIESYSNFQEIFNSSIKFRKYIIIALLSPNRSEVQLIFETMWNFHLCNVIVLHADDDNTVSVLTYFPYYNNVCGNTAEVFTINKFVNGNFMKQNSDFFPPKLKDLQKCEVKIGVSLDAIPCVYKKANDQLNGSDIDVINALSEKLNFKANITLSKNQGFIESNGTSSGPFKLLQEHQVDIITGCYWLTNTRLKFFDGTIPFNNDYSVLIVPPGREFSSFEKLVYPFSRIIWIALVISIIAGYFVIFVLQFTSKKIQELIIGENVNHPNLNLWNALFGGSQPKLPVKNFARILLMTFIIFSLNIRTIYQGSMFQLIHSNKKHDQIQSIEEIVEKNFKVYVLMTSVEFISHLENIKNK